MRYKNLLFGLLIVIGLGAGAFYFNQINKQAHASENALEASYQNNFFSLIENIENLDVLLGKILASNSNDQDIITLATVWSIAEVARTNLDNLPLGIENMMRSNQYLAQLGDFSYSLAQKIANNQEITEAEWQKIRQLHQENRTIHNELRELMDLMQEKQIRLGSLINLNEDKELTPDKKVMLDGFGKLDERLQNEVPTLTYDGPFSDHVVNRAPRGLSGKMINEKEAENIALQFIKNLNNTNYTAKITGKTKGRIPSYSVTLHPKDTKMSDLVLGISQKGGQVVLMMDVGERGQVRNVNVEQAKEQAKEFVQKLDLGDFLPTGHLIEGNELLVNYALLQDGVVIYPDMIQVIVSLDSGNVVAYDANKYLLSHAERKLPKPIITEAEAREKVNKKLKIEEIRLALIPLGNLEEQLAYEIKGKIDEDTYYVYINAENGLQEKILLVVETPQGSRSI
ncbi:MAG: germination protein YpeB [Syntrophomonadaceae bacterium]